MEYMKAIWPIDDHNVDINFDTMESHNQEAKMCDLVNTNIDTIQVSVTDISIVNIEIEEIPSINKLLQDDRDTYISISDSRKQSNHFMPLLIDLIDEDSNKKVDWNNINWENTTLLEQILLITTTTCKQWWN